MELLVTGFVRDEGTIILLKGIDIEDKEYVFAADRRPALDILTYLAHLQDEEPGPTVEVEPWQIVRGH